MKKSLRFILVFITMALQSYIYAQPGVVDVNFNGGDISPAGVNASDLTGEVWGIGIQSDGKIITFVDDSGSKIVRYNVDGTIDSNFGTITSAQRGRALTIQDDDKILVGTIGGDIERYNADGSVDNSYSTSGWPMYIYDLGVQNDGKIVAIGRFQNVNFDYGMTRYNSDGTLDVNFGTNGTVLVDPSANSDWGKSINILSDGKLLLQGATFVTDSDETYLIKLKSNGNLESSFSNDGLLKIDNIGESNFSTRTHELPNGKLIIVGSALFGTSERVFILKLNADGTRDVTFGDSGVVIHNTYDTDSGGFLLNPNTNNSIVLPNGKILVNGILDKPSTVAEKSFAVRQYNSDGTIDENFGVNGIIYANLQGINITTPWIGINADENIIQVGRIVEGGVSDIVAVRYLLDGFVGTLDFGLESKSVLVFPNPIEDNFNLSFNLKNEKELGVFLSDMNGKVINNFYANQKFMAGEHQLNLNVGEDLPAGIYHLTIVEENVPVTVQVIKK
ncbi:MAG: T9SS type A sorting domain-containing protein [Saprospiraceae bacterium]